MEIVESNYFIESLMNTTKDLEILTANFEKFTDDKCKESKEFITTLKQFTISLKQLLQDYNKLYNKLEDTSEEELSETQIQKMNNSKWYDVIVDKYEDFKYWLYFDVYQDFMLFYRIHHNLFTNIYIIVTIAVILLSILFTCCDFK